MKDTKIIFIDLDGTLKNDNGKIDEKIPKVFQNFKDIGIYIVFTTGRATSYTESLAKQFSTSSYLISSNGAEIYNYVSKKSILKSVISKSNLNYLDELIKKYNLMFIANCTKMRYTNKKDMLEKKVNSLNEINEEITQVVIESYDIETMKHFKSELLNNESLKIANKSKDLSEGKLLYYDITTKDASKGNAIKELCKYLNIDINKTMAIGDAINDLEMFSVVKCKVAMENADAELKKIATYITPSNNENGVMQILNKLYSEINN